ncbi:MAG: hypothetical protein ABFD79_09430 [Phycisphaerales bacterium]
MTEKNGNFDLTELKKVSQEIDNLFEKFPAPAPAPALVDDIKRRLQSQKQRISVTKLILKTAAVAAVIIIAWSLVFEDFIRENTDSKASSLSVFSNEDDGISEFEKEFSLLRSEYFTLCLNEDSSNSVLTDSITNLEGDIIETDTSFWKG